MQQNLIIKSDVYSESSNGEKAMEIFEEQNSRANEFNCSIGFNYPYMYAKEVKWISKLKELLKISQQYIETDELERNDFDEEILNNAMNDAVAVIIEQVHAALDALKKAKNKFQ